MPLGSSHNAFDSEKEAEGGDDDEGEAEHVARPGDVVSGFETAEAKVQPE